MSRRESCEEGLELDTKAGAVAVIKVRGKAGLQKVLRGCIVSTLIAWLLQFLLLTTVGLGC